MDWCVRPFGDANHAPFAGWRGDTSRTIAQLAASPGDRIPLDAAGSRDPDGHPLGYRWWIYHEAGSYRGKALGRAVPQLRLYWF